MVLGEWAIEVLEVRIGVEVLGVELGVEVGVVVGVEL